ncbi:crosslink repair DNA glycosylase YcaQ family protein [Gammaproteobacteria bacterium AS21]
MIVIKQPRRLARLRRLALSAQGLLQTNAFGQGRVGALNAINHLGYVQIDTISVVERAHHHVLSARVPNYYPQMLNELLRSGDVFEYWSHAAAFLPIADYRFSLPYKKAIKQGQVHWYKDTDAKLMSELLARITIDGPLKSRDLENDTVKRGLWWDCKPAKKALEQLYMQGDLMVSHRQGFQKSYDLTERVLPTHINTNMPSAEEYAVHMLDQQLRCHGLISLKGITYLRKNLPLRHAVKQLVAQRLADKTLEQVELSNKDVFLVEAGALERRLLNVNKHMQILSPFDNSVIQRDRLKSLFEYDYKIECYVPAIKRQYGYFCLPLLYRARFVGRIDCKAHRKDKHLEIKALFFNELANPSVNNTDMDELIHAFVAALPNFMRFQQCHSVSLTKAFPELIMQKVQNELKQLKL